MIAEFQFAFLFVAIGNFGADYVDFADGSQRQYGLTVAVSDEFIELQQTDQVSGKPRRSKIRKVDIKSHVETIDQARLESLQPGNWKEYRDYAEELSSVKSDPIARETAVRLLAICVANSDAKIRKSAAANLPPLASSEKEKHDFEVIAFLYSDGRRIKIDPAPVLSLQTKSEILQFVRLLRREQFESASSLMSTPKLQEALSQTPLLDVERLTAALNERQISPDLRIRLLRVESELNAGETTKSSEQSTPSLVDPFDQTPVGNRMPLSIDDVFDFDLKATRFINGGWIRP